ncbi:MAG: EpsI family protein [Planctomycetes bacterium]|nr:EpsI family protein [Planctomycetota bacterium]
MPIVPRELQLPQRRRGITITRQTWAGVGAAILFMLASGAGYRVLAARLARSPSSVPLPRGTLAALPLQIADWSGQDVPLAADVIQATDSDDHINRTYSRRGGREAVSLFVAYGVRPRDLMPHRPEVCYPGAGWTVEGKDEIDVPHGSGELVPCQVHWFSRGGLESQQMCVLNYYIIDGGYCRDVSALRAMAWRFDSGTAYVAQVQIACPVQPTSRSPEEALIGFAAESAPLLRGLLRRASEEAAR